MQSFTLFDVLLVTLIKMAILVRNGNTAYSNNYFTFPEINDWSNFSRSVLGIMTLLVYLH